MKSIWVEPGVNAAISENQNPSDLARLTGVPEHVIDLDSSRTSKSRPDPIQSIQGLDPFSESCLCEHLGPLRQVLRDNGVSLPYGSDAWMKGPNPINTGTYH